MFNKYAFWEKESFNSRLHNFFYWFKIKVRCAILNYREYIIIVNLYIFPSIRFKYRFKNINILWIQLLGNIYENGFCIIASNLYPLGDSFNVATITLFFKWENSGNHYLAIHVDHKVYKMLLIYIFY